MEELLKWLLNRESSDLGELLDEFALDHSMTLDERQALARRLFDTGMIDEEV